MSTLKSEPPLTILESYQPILGSSDLCRPLQSPKKSLWWRVVGENQIYCMAQAIFEFEFSELDFAWLWPYWPSPDPHPTWTWTWAWKYPFILKNQKRNYLLRLELDKICQQRNYFLFVAIATDKFSKLSPFLFTAFSFMKDSGKGSDSIHFIGRGACQDWERYILMVVKICQCNNGIF